MINQEEEVQVQQDVDELVAEKLIYINYGLDRVVDEAWNWILNLSFTKTFCWGKWWRVGNAYGLCTGTNIY